VPHPSVSDADVVRERCHEVLRSNWREGELDGARYAYTAPSPQRYPWQWYWDSCFTAVARRRLDPDGARRELESLLAAQAPDGFIGHTIFWGKSLTGVRRLFYTVRARGDLMTATIQPPLLAWCWRIAVGDPSTVPAIAAHHDWLGAQRDLDGDGLLWLIEPDESGLDASPEFDPVWGWRGAGGLGFPLLVRRNRRLGFSLARVAANGGPVACEVMTNVAHALSTLALGRPSITPRLVERLYDERSGLFKTEFRPAPTARVPVSWSALAALALPDLPEAIGRRLVEEHLLEPRRFWTQVAPPSIALEDPAFTTKDRKLGLRQYWRGPTWVNSAWLVWLGLVRLGYDDAAGRLVAGLRTAVLRYGVREYYHPQTGAGMGARDFGWSTLLLELIDPDPAAASSYLPEARET
jgi:hypothetical protein